jgi:Domain of unknown function (DUF4249)
MLKIKDKIKLLLMLVLLSHCTERIDVEVKSSYTRLVVEGYISTDTTRHLVKLTRSGDYFYNKPAQPVTGATVSISDGEDVEILAESIENPGLYMTNPSYYGVPGKVYTLNISRVDIDNNGETEEYSASSELRPVGSVDSIQLENISGTDFSIYEILVFAWDPPVKNFYAFRVWKNGSLITDSLQEMIVQNDIFFNGNYAYGIPSQFLDQGKKDEIIYPGDIITLEINGITEEYYNFILEAQSETFYQTPIFSGPPANISSNISNGALGFFTAWSVTRRSVVFRGN